jgi:hypothetical protein
MFHSALFFIFSLSPTHPATPHIKAETTKKEAAAPKHFDFDDDIIIGEGAGPLYEAITKRPKTKFGSLISPREDFDQELIKSVYEL